MVNDAYTTLDKIKTKKSIAALTDLASGRSVRLTVYPTEQGTMGSGKYQWFSDNCHKYGFILRYPAGKTDRTGVDANASVFRYVGTAHAKYIKENNLCLEEYVEFLKTYDYKKPLTYTDADTGIQYYIYYQKTAAGEVTPVFVPANKSCDISGNNIDGFVVTVASSTNK
jgi:D-alanyl-D-alanine carboxypeptidase